MHDLLPDWKTMNTDTRLSMVREMAREGLSGGGIALRFTNCTRMSVIGLCARNKITLKGIAPKPPGPARKPRKDKPAPRVEAGPAFETTPLPEEELGNDVTALLGIMDLTHDTCRYMFGDPKGQHGYCGKTTKAGSSWCAHHHHVVFGGRS